MRRCCGRTRWSADRRLWPARRARGAGCCRGCCLARDAAGVWACAITAMAERDADTCAIVCWPRGYRAEIEGWILSVGRQQPLALAAAEGNSMVDGSASDRSNHRSTDCALNGAASCFKSIEKRGTAVGNTGQQGEYRLFDAQVAR